MTTQPDTKAAKIERAMEMADDAIESAINDSLVHHATPSGQPHDPEPETRRLRDALRTYLDLIIPEAATAAPGAAPDERPDEREQAARVCDELAEMMESGAGEHEPGGRLRQAARLIREGADRSGAAPHQTAPPGDGAALEGMRARKDAAYEGRNRVVAALARLFPSGVKRTAIEGWSEDWHGCVYIDLPTGQVSWHFHDSQASLFDGLPPYAGEWDGHDTPEKYRRVAALATPHQTAGDARHVVRVGEHNGGDYDTRHKAGDAPNEPCPRGKQRPEQSCTNRHQCWEPCGELGNSEKHVMVGRSIGDMRNSSAQGEREKLAAAMKNPTVSELQAVLSGAALTTHSAEGSATTDRVDAERYRFLRAAVMSCDDAVLAAFEANPDPKNESEFDAAIDAARSQAGQQENGNV